MNNVLDAIPPEPRAVIVDELTRCNPALLAELRATPKPSNDQSRAVVDLLIDAMMKHFGPDWTPNDHGKAIESAIGAYYSTWPM